MATLSSTFAWRIPWTEKPGGLHSTGSQESDATEVTQHTRTQLSVVFHSFIYDCPALFRDTAGLAYFSTVFCVLSCSVVSDSLQPHGLYPARLLCHGFPRQEYWSGLPFPPPGDLPNPGIKPASPLSAGLQADSLLVKPLGKPLTFSQALLFSHSVMSGSLRPHGLQPTTLPCSSPSKYLKCVTMSPKHSKYFSLPN